MLQCRCLGGLEAWGLAVDSLRNDSINQALEAETGDESASEPELDHPTPATAPAAPPLQPDPALMHQLEQLVAQAKSLPPAVRDATLKEVGCT